MMKNRREAEKTGVSTPKHETENLRYVRRVSKERQKRSPTPDFSEEELIDRSIFPPRPAEAGDDWECVRVGNLREDANKEVRLSKNGGIIVDDVDMEFKFVWMKRQVVSKDIMFRDGPKKLSKAATAIRHKRLQRKAFPGTPPGYYPLLKSLKQDAQLAGLVRKCASLALTDYNGQALTDYRFVDIKAVGWENVTGKMYFIVFRARANGKDDTFKACVLKSKVGRLEKRDVYAISVDAVMMMKPGSIARSGTLQELI